MTIWPLFAFESIEASTVVSMKMWNFFQKLLQKHFKKSSFYELTGQIDEKSCTFKVAAVTPEKPKLEFSDISTEAETVARYWDRYYSPETNTKLEFEVGFVNHEQLLSSYEHFDQNALLATVLAAYNNHIPLILSPDDLWLPIALSVGQFLGEDEKMAEKYRKSFVSHKGKKTLTVDVLKYGIIPKAPASNGAGWPGAIEEMCGKIKNDTATNVADIMTSPFSTSGAVEQTVMRATLMESMKNYCKYDFVFLCGIPEITLEGTIDDYQSIIDRVDGLLMIFPCFKWYLNRIRGHLIKILEGRKGKVDQNWWCRMVKSKPDNCSAGCGSPATFSGWTSDFFAFKFQQQQNQPNKQGNSNFDSFNKPAVTMTDFLLDDLSTKTWYDMKLVAGFVGVALDENKPAVRPAIGWMTFYIQPINDDQLGNLSHL